jgi:hypothetical protein
LLNIIILKSFLKNNLYIHLLYVCIILKSYLMIPNKYTK